MATPLKTNGPIVARPLETLTPAESYVSDDPFEYFAAGYFGLPSPTPPAEVRAETMPLPFKLKR